MKITRTNISLKADHRRVLARPFVVSNEERLQKIFSRILSLPKDKCSEELNNILTDFEFRHKNIKTVFAKRADELKGHIKDYDKLAQEQRLLIGAYFTMEYSVEAAALFNPSIVWHPDQTKLHAGSKRFVVSLRSTGEGHISSITFRSGVIDSGNNIKL
ncbi:MAG TPA: glycosidase, partial [Ignavibacteriales bacterium]|nr:glycosidase [Ignavibacteriales bacterium]